MARRILYSKALGRKERRAKVKKIKNSSVVRKAIFKRAKDRDSDSDGLSVYSKTGTARRIRAKKEKAKDTNKEKKKKKGTKAEFIRVDRLWSKDKRRFVLEKSSEYTEAGKYKHNTEKKKAKPKEIALKARHLKVLVNYLNKDYSKTKKSLYPLLESKKITFDLLWILFKSDEIVYTPIYNTEDKPRAFKLEYANLDHSLLKDHEQLEKEIIKRGKKFVALKARNIVSRKKRYDIVQINMVQKEDIEELQSQNNSGKREFTDKEYLITSPVAFGFSFGEKLWLEFAVSSIQDIAWNESAFDSLVIPSNQKHVLKSLVELHERNTEKNIDNIIQG
ncbi:MAG: hypothetical protein Q9163_004345 [Psora crenata]